MSQNILNSKLFDAARNGDAELCKELLGQGAEVAAGNAGWTALHYSAANGHTEICRLFVESGADINALNNVQSTPMVSAVKNGQRATVIYFVEECGECIDQTAYNGMTLEEIAGAYGEPEMVDFLIAYRNSLKTSQAIEDALPVEDEVAPFPSSRTFSPL